MVRLAREEGAGERLGFFELVGAGECWGERVGDGLVLRLRGEQRLQFGDRVREPIRLVQEESQVEVQLERIRMRRETHAERRDRSFGVAELVLRGAQDADEA